jgi:mannose-6-phosphate isomerase-like protein (cupin superfamily)
MIRRSVAALKSSVRPGVEWLLHPGIVPGCRGRLLIDVQDQLAASGAASPMAAGESVAFVLAGHAHWRTNGTTRPLGPGDGVFKSGGSRVQLAPCGPTEPTISLVVLGTADVPPSEACSCQLPRPTDGATTTNSTEYLDSAGGFLAMGVHWLATSETVGTRTVVLATSTFTPGGSHQLHRHSSADEFFLLLEGAGEHLTEQGAVRLERGDLAFIPAGEWHGFRTDPGIITRTVYGYLGAGTLEQAGYELREVES